MQVPGLPLDDPFAHELIRHNEPGVSKHDNIDAELAFTIEQCFLGYRGSRQNFRPYLKLVGELRDIKPKDRLPGLVNRVTYPLGQGPKVDVTYEFEDEQLISLVQKGYFEQGFEVPRDIIGLSMEELPVKCDFIVIEPFNENEKPVVYAEVRDRAQLTYDWETSGYDLSDSFATPEQQHELDRAVPMLSDSLVRESLFDKDDDYQLDEINNESSIQNSDDYINEIQEEHAKRIAQLEPQEEIDKTSADYVYETEIKPSLNTDKGSSVEVERVEVSDQVSTAHPSLFSDIDDEDEDEFGVSGIVTNVPELDVNINKPVESSRPSFDPMSMYDDDELVDSVDIDSYVPTHLVSEEDIEEERKVGSLTNISMAHQHDEAKALHEQAELDAEFGKHVAQTVKTPADMPKKRSELRAIRNKTQQVESKKQVKPNDDFGLG